VGGEQSRGDQARDLARARLRRRREQRVKGDRSDKQAAHELRVGPTAEFPSRAGTLQDQRDVAPLGGEQPILERPGQLSVASNLRDEASESRLRLVGWRST
jgi:hypothetical protein